MEKLSKAHKAEILKRMLKKNSPQETNISDQTIPGAGNPGMGMPSLPGMGMPQGMGPGMPPGPGLGMPPPQMPIPTEQTESYDQNPARGLGNQLLQGLAPALQQQEKTKLAPIDDLIKNEADAAQIWKVMGGMDSVPGRVWQELSSKSKIYDSGRDYFISCYNKYMQNPDKFKKINPREALLIKHTSQIMEEE